MPLLRLKARPCKHLDSEIPGRIPLPQMRGRFQHRSGRCNLFDRIFRRTGERPFLCRGVSAPGAGESVDDSAGGASVLSLFPDFCFSGTPQKAGNQEKTGLTADGAEDSAAGRTRLRTESRGRAGLRLPADSARSAGKRDRSGPGPDAAIQARRHRLPKTAERRNPAEMKT